MTAHAIQVPDDRHEIAAAHRQVAASAARASMDLQSQRDARKQEIRELDIPLRRIGRRNHLAEALARVNLGQRLGINAFRHAL